MFTKGRIRAGERDISPPAEGAFPSDRTAVGDQVCWDRPLELGTEGKPLALWEGREKWIHPSAKGVREAG